MNEFENIKTFEDACQVLGISSATPVVTAPDEFSVATEAYRKLLIIAKALRGNWKPDWSDYGQRKWFAWFDVVPSGFGFSTAHCDYTYTRTDVGSRLCFPTHEMAEYFGEQFIDLHRIVLTLPQ